MDARLSRKEMRSRVLALIGASKKSGLGHDVSGELGKALKEAYQHNLLSPAQEFDWAMCVGDLEVVKETILDKLQQFEKVSFRDPGYAKMYDQPIQCAIEGGHFKVIKWVLDYAVAQLRVRPMSLSHKSLGWIPRIVDYTKYAYQHKRYQIAGYLSDLPYPKNKYQRKS